jgi:membrane protein YqaA with SNARE-associated domain
MTLLMLDSSPEPAATVDRTTKYETTFAILRMVASFAVLIGIVAFLGWAFRSDLSRFGTWFVDRFGFAGMAGGAFLADGLHFPIPPQFYLLTGIAAGHATSAVVLAVLVGSELGGLTAFSLARTIGRWSIVARRLETSRRLLLGAMERRGYLGLAAATLLPISFSLLCMASGAMRLPYKAYGVLAVMRIPRILLSYAVIMLAWQ